VGLFVLFICFYTAVTRGQAISIGGLRSRFHECGPEMTFLLAQSGVSD